MPDAISRYLGIPETAEGEGTVWNVQWETPWPHWLPDWLGCGVLALIWIVAMLVLSRDARSVSLRNRVWLLSLRTLIFAGMFLVLFQPVLSVNRTIKPIIGILVDHSLSMSLVDESTSESSAELGESGRTRLDYAQGALLDDEGQLLRELLETHNVRIYSFSETASLLGEIEGTVSGRLETVVDSVANLRASGETTQPGPSVVQALNEMKSAPPSALILLSDGIATGEQSSRGALSEALPALKKSGTSLWAIGIGSTTPARDVELLEVRAPEAAFLGDPIRFDTLVRQQGFDGKPVALQLSARGSDTPLQTQSMVLANSAGPLEQSLEWQPDRTGQIDLEIRVGPLEGEANPQNNVLFRSVYVRDTPLNVLLAERTPRYEFRYLKHFLEREKSVRLDSLLFEGDRRYALQDRSGQSLAGRFPVRADQLFAYDVIIVGDVSPDELGPGVLNLLKQFVEVRGKSLILLAGPHFNPVAYRTTPLETLFPVSIEPTPFTIPARWKSDGFQAMPTPAGLQGTPAFRWSTGESDPFAFWKSIPAWYHVYPWPELKSGAIVWLTTGGDNPRLPRLPLIVEQRYGAGKVVFHSTDELWRLRFLSEDRYYGKFWLQTLRYLTRSDATNSGVELTTDRQLYQQSEPITIRLRLPTTNVNRGQAPVVKMTGPRTFEQTLSPAADHPELFLAEIPFLPEGNYRVEFQQTAPAGTVSTDFRVQPGRRELSERRLNRAELSDVAKKSGGGYLDLDQVDQLPRLLPPGRKILLESLDPLPLWNRWELFVLLLSLLTIEWLLRKRFQLL